MKTALILPLAALIAATAAYGQGSLTPPSGFPAASMKTLDQVEARTPLVAGAPGVSISAAGTITISQPGSYYLTRNLTITTAGAHGISVSSDNVTLDLGGFSLICTGVDGGTAVHINSASSVRVHNGHVVGGTTLAGNSFTLAGWQSGVVADGTKPNQSAADVTVRGVRTTGILLLGQNSRVERCSVHISGGSGIQGGFISSCSVLHSGASAIVAAAVGTAIVDNSNGETISTLSNHRGIEAEFGTVSNSGGESIAGLGLFARNASNCRGKSSSGTGLAARNAINCQGQCSSGTGLSASNASNCSGSSDTGIGMNATCASNCQGTSNGGAYGMLIQGTASFCQGLRSGGTAIQASIAIGCTSSGGTITSAQKHLGTP